MANWKKFLFKDKKSKKLLDYLEKLPGPSPWALNPGQRVHADYKWLHVENIRGADGNTLLLNKDNKAVLILGFQNYVLELPEKRILIWRQDEGREISSNPVKFTVLDLNKLKPFIDDLKEIYKSDKLKKSGIYFEGLADIQFEVSSLQVNEDIDFQFPEQLKFLGELFILCDSTGIRASDYRQANRGLMVLNLQEDRFHIYPQEWFNNGSFDFGYQWIAKVGREPESGEIVGEGVRIGTFVLKADFSGIKKVL